MVAEKERVPSQAPWGLAAFDSDAALRWIESFLEQSSEARLFAALGEPQHDFRWEEEALAACEAIAAWRGAASPELPVSLARFTFSQGYAVPASLLQLARKRVEGLKAGGALRNHWRGRARLAAFESRMDDLLSRLGTSR